MTETLELAPKADIQEHNLKAELKEPFANEWFARTAQELREHDRQTYDHSLRVGVLAGRIAKRLGLNEDEHQKAGLSHDFGKLHVPEHIIQKNGPLTKSEQASMDTHPDAGFLMVQPHDQRVAEIIVGHHEYQERSYPRKNISRNLEQPEKRAQKGDSLQTSQLVVVLADLTDAWMSERSYKPAMSPSKTKEQLMDAFAHIKQSRKIDNPAVADLFDDSLIDFTVQTRESLTA